MGQQCILCPPRPPLPPPRWLSAPCWAPRRASCAAASPFIGPDTVSAPLMLGGRPPSAPRHPLLCTSASPAPQPFRPSSVWGRNTSSTRPPTPPCSPPPPCTHWLQIEGKGGRWGGGGQGDPRGCVGPKEPQMCSRRRPSNATSALLRNASSCKRRLCNKAQPGPQPQRCNVE